MKAVSLQDNQQKLESKHKKFLKKIKKPLEEEAKNILKDLIKNPDLKVYGVGNPHYMPRQSNTHTEPYNIIVVPIIIKDSKLFSVFVGNSCRNRTKCEDHLTGYVNAKAQDMKLDNIYRVRCDLAVPASIRPHLDVEYVNDLPIDKAIEGGIIEEKSPIWNFYKSDYRTRGLEKFCLTVAYNTELIGPSVQVALLAGILVAKMGYDKILDLFCGSGTTTHAMMKLTGQSANYLNIFCIDKKIKASMDSLSDYTKTVLMLEEDIMEFLKTPFLEQKFQLVVADPPHSIIYDFVMEHGEKISKNCTMFLLYFAHMETEKWNSYILEILQDWFEVYKVSVGGEVMAVCLSTYSVDKTSEKRDEQRKYLGAALEEFTLTMKSEYGQTVDIKKLAPLIRKNN